MFEIDFREILTFAMIFMPLERLLPQQPDQKIFRRHWLNDSFYLVFNGIIVRLGAVMIIAAVMAQFPSRLPAGGFGPIGALPLWLQVILAVIVADIGFYAHHRLFHAVPFLWQFHAIHHSIEELDWLAAHRVHAFDQVVSSTFMVLPLFLLGFSAPAMALWGMLYLLTSHLVHSNIKVNFGPLRWLIASPSDGAALLRPFSPSPACGRGDARASAAGEGVPACRSRKNTLTLGRLRRLSLIRLSGRGVYSPSTAAMISRSTLSMSVSTRAFQKRITAQPSASRNAVRRASAASA